MEPTNEPRFSVSDRFNDAEVGPRLGPLGSSRLPAFEAHQPTYDEAELRQMVRRGTAAWSDVPNATDWVEDLRGGKS